MPELVKRPPIEEILNETCKRLMSEDDHATLLDTKIPALCNYALELERRIEKMQAAMIFTARRIGEIRQEITR